MLAARCMQSIVGIAMFAAPLGGACTPSQAASKAPPALPQRAGVYLRSTGSSLTQLAALRRADSAIIWEAGPEVGGAIQVLSAGSELAPCTEADLAIYAVGQVGTQAGTGWPSLLRENGARTHRISVRTELLQGDPARSGPSWMLDGIRANTICELVLEPGALAKGQYLIWNGDADASSSLRAFPFRVR